MVDIIVNLGNKQDLKIESEGANELKKRDIPDPPQSLAYKHSTEDPTLREDPPGDLSSAAFNFDDEAGINRFIAEYKKLLLDLKDPDANREELQERLKELHSTFNKRFAEEVELSEDMAEPALQLADELKAMELTPAVEALWLRLLEDLTPGPYADYLLRCLDSVETSGSEVHTHLKAV